VRVKSFGMETRIFLILLVIQICNLSSAAILKLGGVVPDRGVAVTATGIEVVKKSEMKVFVSKGDRINWRRLSENESITSSSLIRVQAP
jgi:hypothetical protein